MCDGPFTLKLPQTLSITERQSSSEPTTPVHSRSHRSCFPASPCQSNCCGSLRRMRDLSCFPYLRSSQVHRGYPGAEASDSQCPQIHRGLHHRTPGTDDRRRSCFCCGTQLSSALREVCIYDRGNPGRICIACNRCLDIWRLGRCPGVISPTPNHRGPHSPQRLCSRHLCLDSPDSTNSSSSTVSSPESSSGMYTPPAGSDFLARRIKAMLILPLALSIVTSILPPASAAPKQIPIANFNEFLTKNRLPPYLPFSIKDSKLFHYYPPLQLRRRCVEILHTSKLAPADCSLPSYCGQVHWSTFQSTWYGSEVGACVGTGVHPPVRYEPSPFYHILNQGKWFRSHTVISTNQPYPYPIVKIHKIDTQATLSELRLLEGPDEWLLVTARQLDFSLYVTENLDEPKYPKYDWLGSGGSYCLVQPDRSFPLQPLARADNPDSLLEVLPVLVSADIKISNIHRDVNTTGICYPLSTYCVFRSGYVDSHSNISQAVTCDPFKMTTQYNIPGYSWLKKAILFFIESVVDTLISIILSLFDEFLALLRTLNEKYRVFEYLALIGFCLWRFQNPWPTVSIVGFTLAMIGLAR
nr:hPS protein [Chronic bee paralysis virus]